MLVLQTQQWGMTPSEAASGAEALARLDQGECFDVALLDWLMAEMDGLELAGHIRQRQPNLPLIMISSAGRPENCASVIAEFAAFLTKPVKQSQLYNVLADLWGDGGAQARAASPMASEFDELLGQRLPMRVLVAEDHTRESAIDRAAACGAWGMTPTS